MQPPPRQYRVNPGWWVVFWMLMAWNLWTFLPRSSAEVALPYSAFLAQVKAGNVSQVRIQGDAITGSVTHAIAWPPGAGGSGASNKSATPADTSKSRPSPTYSAFRTTFPSAVGDASLLPLLEAHDVVIDVASPSPSWFAIILSSGLPVVLILALLFWMGRQAARSQAGVFSFTRSKARRYTEDRPKVTFADVAGVDEAKADLGEVVEMFVGVGASRVRDLFVQAKAAEPCIVFVDELDAVGRRRGAGVGPVNDEREQTLNQLLVEMDGFDERQQVILLAATNRPDVLDPALLRPGRFDRQVVVPLPDRRGREGILRIHTRHLHLAADVDLERLARTATGLSGADLANLCNEAALCAARHNRTEVTMPDFDEAWDKIVLGAERKTVLSERERRVIAYHEGGHA